MRYIYRVLEATNTKTRRLAYLSAIISLLRDEALTERAFLEKLTQWAKNNTSFLHGYWVDTGEITSTYKNSAGTRYIDLARKIGLVTTIGGMYRASRDGLILYSLLKKEKPIHNPFFLSDEEKSFFTYLLISEDADVLLTIINQIDSNQDISLSELQNSFYKDFLDRLERKSNLIEEDIDKRQILERRNIIAHQWKKPERYSEHIIPPRINWMCDLDLLDIGLFRKHKCRLSASGKHIFSCLPLNGGLIDVSEEWLEDSYWKVCATSIFNKKSILWENLDDVSRASTILDSLMEAFRNFQYSQIPRISSRQAILYMTIFLLSEKNIVASPTELTNWFSFPRIIQNKKYEIRLSPRENESYLLASLI